MDTVSISILCVCALFVMMAIGAPVFVSLGVSSIVGILLLQGFDALSAVPGVMYDRMASFTLVAVPLFILMGEIIFVSGLGGDIYRAIRISLYRIRGSLAVASVFACAVFGAMCGVSIAGAATIGKFAIPEMLKAGYDKRIATGVIASAGSLALLIPPSVGLILYGLVAGESVGYLFIAGVIPGIIIALMMMIYLLILGWFKPHLMPSVTLDELEVQGQENPWIVTIPALLLVFAVLGSIYFGIATPSESAAIGCLGALAIAAYKRMLSFENIAKIIEDTTRTTGMILAILSSALVFGYLLTRLRVPQELVGWIVEQGFHQYSVLVAIFILLIVMGMFMDVISVILIATPLLLPIIKTFNYDPIWFGIVMAICCEMAVITPPVGLNLFVIQGISPGNTSLMTVAEGAFPFFLILVAAVVLFTVFPGLVLWLPFG
ncbi:TRAP transporter large permease subunit [Litorivicinus sp.]|jgi:C4-dicarboxylate transporter DctM subunit|nr:TRAP transporter large permease subunit [Litorivicinus sp.]MDB9862407.1 TRAP transporter large permease subunit [Litorivicinus sp.]MDC1240924.1 TRAP transporter large permease subunit [Litorivicinus sp.]MDC1466640.1 TRAP transporter large permease subunit [Litorivicinus sp.]|tara:strand:+ start:1232 stop:2533 length:1302 start_codon:yes stop_codon:yes gene_type:complete